jgi:hypothetical protein
MLQTYAQGLQLLAAIVQTLCRPDCLKTEQGGVVALCCGLQSAAHGLLQFLCQ